MYHEKALRYNRWFRILTHVFWHQEIVSLPNKAPCFDWFNAFNPFGEFLIIEMSPLLVKLYCRENLYFCEKNAHTRGRFPYMGHHRDILKSWYVILIRHVCLSFIWERERVNMFITKSFPSLNSLQDHSGRVCRKSSHLFSEQLSLYIKWITNIRMVYQTGGTFEAGLLHTIKFCTLKKI